MSKKDFKSFKTTIPSKPKVTSLLDVMKDGKEYHSLLDVDPAGINLVPELRRAVADVEAIRQRPLLIYTANTVSSRITDVPLGIVLADDLPSTPGGGKDQSSRSSASRCSPSAALP